MKFIRSAQATPSVFKGIYTVLFLIVFTPFLFSQNSNHEIGIGLRPLTIKEEPYNFTYKKYISNKVALRTGIGFVFHQDKQDIFYIHPNAIDIRLMYEYGQINKYLSANCFVGVQYGKKIRNTFLYLASDLVFGYGIDKIELPNGIKYTETQLLPNQYFLNTVLKDNKTFTLGFRQSIGIQYFITPAFSLLLEGGITYNFQKLMLSGGSYFTRSDSAAKSYVGYTYELDRSIWNYIFSVSPLTFLSLNHHF